jgi:hypothetical protein
VRILSFVLSISLPLSFLLLYRYFLLSSVAEIVFSALDVQAAVHYNGGNSLPPNSSSSSAPVAPDAPAAVSAPAPEPVVAATVTAENEINSPVIASDPTFSTGNGAAPIQSAGASASASASANTCGRALPPLMLRQEEVNVIVCVMHCLDLLARSDWSCESALPNRLKVSMRTPLRRNGGSDTDSNSTSGVVAGNSNSGADNY